MSRAAVPVMEMPEALLPEMTFRAPVEVPPMTFRAPAMMEMPWPAEPLPMATLPAASRPTMLPAMTLSDESELLMPMPSLRLPDTTLPAPVAVPPMVLWWALPLIDTPCRLAMAVEPSAPRPT